MFPGYVSTLLAVILLLPLAPVQVVLLAQSVSPHRRCAATVPSVEEKKESVEQDG